MEKDNSIMKGQGEDGKWITVNGTHIFVEEGQSVKDAVNTKFDKKSRADEELTKRAETLHKIMKEAGLPVKKSIEETRAIMRNLDKMPDYGAEGAKDQHRADLKKVLNMTAIKNMSSGFSKHANQEEKNGLKTGIDELYNEIRKTPNQTEEISKSTVEKYKAKVDELNRKIIYCTDEERDQVIKKRDFYHGKACAAQFIQYAQWKK